MTNNKTALRLSLYFGVALLVFAVVMGSIFMLLFRRHSMELHKNEMQSRAVAIADTVSSYWGGNGNGYGGRGSAGGGFSGYLRNINSIAGADAWVVDANRNLITPGMGHMGGKAVSYTSLPDNAESIISRVLEGNTVFSEDFSSLLEEPTLTVGVPIWTAKGDVIGAVLLHSPVNGTNQAIRSSMGLLAISIIVGILLSFLLSLWLSKSFTDPIVLKEAQDALKMEQIRQDFVANISHELKTPITVMRGSLEALNDKVVTDPAMVESYHRQMLNETLHLQRLVGDLLDLSRLQNADFQLEKQLVSFTDLLNEVLRSAQQIGLEKQIVFDVRLVPGCMVWGDYGRLRQMVMIVLDNAVKFSPQGGRVTVRLQDNRLTVEDQGAGILPQDAPYIFDRFYKTSTEENKTGSGLGLAIAKQVAQRHDIGLSVQSTENGGACFLFDLRENMKSLEKNDKKTQ